MMGNRNGAEEGLTFAFRFTDATISIPNQGMLDFAPAVPFPLYTHTWASLKYSVSIPARMSALSNG